jgi:hypothetical protein
MEDERKRSIWEDPRSLMTVRFEEGVQALTPRLLQSSQNSTNVGNHREGDGSSEIQNPKPRCNLDRRSKDLSGPTLTIESVSSKFTRYENRALV